MSLSILKIISTNPSYAPETIKQEKAKAFLAELYKNKEVKFYNTDLIEFIDQGGNFDNVSCNLCGQEIEIEHWQNAMDEAFERAFIDLDFITLCCHQKTSLNDLNYEMAAGFAKFVMTIIDAANEIEEKDINNLEEILETKLKIIWARY